MLAGVSQKSILKPGGKTPSFILYFCQNFLCCGITVIFPA